MIKKHSSNIQTSVRRLALVTTIVSTNEKKKLGRLSSFCLAENFWIDIYSQRPSLFASPSFTSNWMMKTKNCSLSGRVVVDDDDQKLVFLSLAPFLGCDAHCSRSFVRLVTTTRTFSFFFFCYFCCRAARRHEPGSFCRDTSRQRATAKLDSRWQATRRATASGASGMPPVLVVPHVRVPLRAHTTTRLTTVAAEQSTATMSATMSARARASTRERSTCTRKQARAVTFILLLLAAAAACSQRQKFGEMSERLERNSIAHSFCFKLRALDLTAFVYKKKRRFADAIAALTRSSALIDDRLFCALASVAAAFADRASAAL